MLGNTKKAEAAKLEADKDTLLSQVADLQSQLAEANANLIEVTQQKELAERSQKLVESALQTEEQDKARAEGARDQNDVLIDKLLEKLGNLSSKEE